jgi:hypothetical protein
MRNYHYVVQVDTTAYAPFFVKLDYDPAEFFSQVDIHLTIRIWNQIFKPGYIERLKWVRRVEGRLPDDYSVPYFFHDSDCHRPMEGMVIDAGE